jgi:hypothetical protein
MADPHINFAYSSVATAPSPATSGLSLVLATGDGAKFPASGAFNVTVWATSAQPTTANAEIVRVASRSGDTFTLAARAQETAFGGPAARTIVVGDQVALTETAKTLQDIEATAFPVVQTTTSTGTQNDFVLTADCDLLRCNNATLLTLTGFAAGYDGQRVVIASIGAGQVDFSHQAAGSTAANRLINFATSGTTSLAAGVGTAEIEYDATTARWRLVRHEQGAWITRTFAAGNYTASAGTWTVAGVGVSRDAFYLKGRTLYFSVAASGTTSGTPVSVKVTLPNTYSAAANDIAASYTSNNGSGVAESGYCQPATTTLNFQRIGNATFAAGTVGVNAAALFEVN